MLSGLIVRAVEAFGDGFTGNKAWSAPSLLEDSTPTQLSKLSAISAELAHFERNGEKLKLARRTPRCSI